MNSPPRGGNGKNNLCDRLLFLGYLYRKCVEIIGFKAPGDYSDQFGSHKISILLCEGPKAPNSMIS